MPERDRVLPWLLLPLGALLTAGLLLRPTYGVAAIGAVVVVVTGAASIAYPLGLSGFAAPIIALLGRDPFPSKSVPLIVFGWIVVGLAFGWSSELARRVRGVLTKPLVWLSVALLGLMLLRLPASTDSTYAHLKVELFVMSNLALLLAGIVLGTRHRTVELFLILLLLIDAVSGLLVIREFGQPAAAVDRFTLPQEGIISLGAQGAEGVMVSTYLMLRGSTPWRRMLGTCLLPVTFVSLLASGSRGPVLGGAAGLVALLVLLARSRTSAVRLLALAVLFVVSFVAVLQIVPSGAAHRSLSTITGTKSGLASNGRNQLWSAGWSAFVNHPALGIGTGSFATYGRQLVCPGPGCQDKYPHNILLETAAELGIVGLFLTAAIIVAGGVLLLRVWRRGDPDLRATASIVFSLYLAAAITSMLTSDITGHAEIWLLGGIGLGLSTRLTRRETSGHLRASS